MPPARRCRSSDVRQCAGLGTDTAHGRSTAEARAGPPRPVDDSGTKCAAPLSFSRLVRFIRAAGTPPLPTSRSNSTHSALRSSPGRTKTRGASRSAARVYRHALVAFDGPQQLAHPLGIGDGRHVLHEHRLQAPAQIRRRIAFGSPGRNCVPEHLAARLQSAMRSLKSHRALRSAAWPRAAAAP